MLLSETNCFHSKTYLAAGWGEVGPNWPLTFGPAFAHALTHSVIKITADMIRLFDCIANTPFDAPEANGRAGILVNAECILILNGAAYVSGYAA